ncbi:hypothetical protein JCM8547_000427 [Rhodosporidiobolus lusitaniae]
MSRLIVRQSSYRHTFGTAAKREDQYDNIKISASAWDSNLVSASSKYLAVNWQASGGGAFLVTPLDKTGKLPDLFPLCRAHTAAVLDTHWSPFDDSLVASVGEDGKLAVTQVDEQLLRDAWSGDHKDLPDLQPLWSKSAHGRKAGHVRFHPTASGVLATASNDVKIWDLEAQKATLNGDAHADMVQSIDWSYTGDVFATTCKDRKLRLFDPRTGSAAITVVDSHLGVKGSRVAFLGSLDRIVTTGFSKTSDRQVFLWDSRDLQKGPIKQMQIDQSSGMIMPFFSEANNVLFLAGKGDGNVRMYELENDDLFYLSDYSSPQPQRGMCFAPSRSVNVSETEIARAYKAVGNCIEPISFKVPRKSESFQADLYPPVPSDQPALSAADWFGGKSASPILVNLESGEKTTSATPVKAYKPSPPPAATPAPAAAAAPSPAPIPAPELTKAPSPPAASTPAREPSPPPAPKAAAPVSAPEPALAPASFSHGTSANGSSDNEGEVKGLKEEVKSLKAELSEKDAHIRELELKLERVKSAIA